MDTYENKKDRLKIKIPKETTIMQYNAIISFLRKWFLEDHPSAYAVEGI